MTSQENKESQKFVICKTCSMYSPMSENIPTCEKCTRVIVNAALPYITMTKKPSKDNCNGCGKESYSHLFYDCDCGIAKFCFECYTSAVMCPACSQLKLYNITKTSIWSPQATSQNKSTTPKHNSTTGK